MAYKPLDRECVFAILRVMKHFLVVMAAMASYVTGSKGAIVWDSFGAPTSGGANFQTDIWLAQGFKVFGSNSSRVSTVTLTLDGTVSGTAHLELYSNVDAPVTLFSTPTSTKLADFGHAQINEGSTGNIIFNPAGYVGFTPGQIYWFVLRMDAAPGSGSWVGRSAYTESSFNGTSPSFWGSRLSSDLGASWSNAGFVLSLQLNLTTVPEPEFLGAAVGLALFGWGISRRAGAIG